MPKYLDGAGLSHFWESIKPKLGGVTQSGTGTVVSSDDAANLPLLSLTIHGKSVQEGTPSPSSPVPIQSVESCNLLDTSISQTTIAQVTYTNGPDGSVVLNGTKQGGSYAAIKSGIGLFLPAGTYRLYAQLVSGTATNAPTIYLLDASSTAITSVTPNTAGALASAKVTLAEAKTVAVLRFALWTDGSVYTDATYQIWLENGSTTHDYQPYGSITLVTGSDRTDIDLQGHALRSLPDGTEDTLEVDGEGNGAITKHTGMSYNELVTMGAGTYYDTDCYQDFSKDFSMYIDFTRVGASRHCFVSAYPSSPSLGIELNTNGNVRFYLNYTSGITDRVVGSAVPIGSECRFACMWKASEGRIYWVEEIDGSRTNGTVVPNAAPSAKCSTPLRLGGDHRSATGAAETFTPAWTQVNATPYFEEPFPDDWQSKTWLWGEDGKAVWVDEADTMSTTGTMLAGSEIVYPLATPQTISLGKIDLPSLPSPSFSLHVDALVTPTLDAEWLTEGGGRVIDAVSTRITALESEVAELQGQVTEREVLYDTSTWTILRYGRTVMVQVHGATATPSTSTALVTGILSDCKPAYNCSATVLTSSGSSTQAARMAVYADTGNVYIVPAGYSSSASWYGTLTYIY